MLCLGPSEARSPTYGLVPQGRPKITQDAVLGTTWLTFSRPLRDFRRYVHGSQDRVLGDPQPSLRD